MKSKLIMAITILLLLATGISLIAVFANVAQNISDDIAHSGGNITVDNGGDQKPEEPDNSDSQGTQKPDNGNDQTPNEPEAEVKIEDIIKTVPFEGGTDNFEPTETVASEAGLVRVYSTGLIGVNNLNAEGRAVVGTVWGFGGDSYSFYYRELNDPSNTQVHLIKQHDIVISLRYYRISDEGRIYKGGENSWETYSPGEFVYGEFDDGWRFAEVAISFADGYKPDFRYFQLYFVSF